MTKDEIKKALLYCQDYDWDNCDDCPYTKSKTCGMCKEHMHDDALVLITEQEKEINLLQMQMKDVVNHADTFLAEANKFEAENKKLKAENKMRLINLKTALDDIKQAKIDVLTELREKCKFDGHMVAVYKNDIDEMIEELKK